MNKKIVISLSTIAAVAAVAVGGTMALFSDTETSNANIFTAGSIDLKVDHTRQTYNGVDCKTCKVEIVSDTTNVVNEKNGASFGPSNALVVTPTSITSTYWTATIPGASWIWATDPVTQQDSDNATTYTFEKTFSWFGPISGATINLGVAGDNSYEVFLNGTSVGADTNVDNFSSVDNIVNIDDNIIQGTNTLKIKVTNAAQPSLPPLNNPGGLLYKLTIDGNCGDAYFQNHCELWQSTDLTNQKFFSFDDVKPGDQGTNVISLSVTSNDAYVCLNLANKQDNENTLVDPEVALGDTASVGELSQYLNVVVWADDNDGVHENGETVLYQGLLSGMTPQSLALATSTTKYLGLAWCAGTQSPVATGDDNLSGVACSGAGDQNIAQTDSFVADVVATAVQQRNNENFFCPGTETADTASVSGDEEG